jgi:hypothetical protein
MLEIQRIFEIHWFCKSLSIKHSASASLSNGLWIGFPLYNRAIVLRHFHRKGWEQS